MSIIKVHRKDQNIELASKLMNSVAAKYDCSVKYNTESGTINFSGDDVFKRHIIEETASLFMKRR